jgi:RimJ/RimL family protein N-acetyltransferase
MVIMGQKVSLRDIVEEDISDYQRWFFTEDEWQKWDAPWEKGAEVALAYIDKLYQRLKQGFPEPRSRFDIWADNKHLGWVSCYLIGGDANYLAVGISLPEADCWGKGIGSEALRLWVQYLFQTRKPHYLYCETWAGNARMINLALKTGFEAIEEYLKLESDGKEYRKIKFRICGASFQPCSVNVLS